MLRIIHPNRWLVWTIALIVMIFIVVWGAIERYAIEQEVESIGQNSQLGRETSKLDTTGWKTYRNEEYGFEFKYPPSFNVGEAERGYVEVRSTDAERLVISPPRQRGTESVLAFVHNDFRYDEDSEHSQYSNDYTTRMINGFQVYGFDLLLSSRVERHSFILKDQNSGVDIFYVLAGDDQVWQVFGHIISTFTFFNLKQ